MKTSKDKLQMFNEVEAECRRFLTRIDAAKKRVKDDELTGYYYAGSKQMAALKRSALDLKNELSRITKMGVTVFE